ncbi:hypothetical protein V1L54_17855 [Streptomyces sp. TRM 70361]|uniref:hypothetical protein n=1 Tax=Streptomyces sp. TRM 70361 TaxID=3116553 RepID=UPI002E7BDB0E|nr:hypothetical protein [Streptomyces sp. TRM 70361]MEE1941248.1 hypothetical protein [Streptomyces sp. TRM 70361]
MAGDNGGGRTAGELHHVRRQGDTGPRRALGLRQLRGERMTPFPSEVPAHDVALMHCGQCGWAVQEGPLGGYVCTQCFHTVEPPTGLLGD